MCVCVRGEIEKQTFAGMNFQSKIRLPLSVTTGPCIVHKS